MSEALIHESVNEVGKWDFFAGFVQLKEESSKISQPKELKSD